MFNNIFREMNIKKVIHWVGGGNGGTVLISSWKCNSVFTWIYKYITWIQVYYFDPSKLRGYPSNIHTCMPSIGSWCAIIKFFIIHVWINRSPEKWRFRSLQSLLLPQFLTYRHRTRLIVKKKQVRITNYLGNTNKLVIKNTNFKIILFSKKYAQKIP